ncbi:MAG TPA: response regulator transcription factor [Ignavibacteriales bacterium]|jgi:DNA-binding response OmpR family regulator|nr:response regulator transcription factor [Ignavibacteriales bacterium]
MKILLVEDEKQFANSIKEYIEKENYVVEIAYDFWEAKEKIELSNYDCILLDIMLPSGSGLDLIPDIHEFQPKCGIIVITAKNTIDDRVIGLELGADDYITKPFHLAELNARIKAVLRRRFFDGKKVINFNEIQIDIDNREIFVNQNKIDLTKREYEIFMFLFNNKNRLITKDAIIEYVWGDDSNNFDNFDFIYTHIKNLRKKLINSGCKDYIQSIYGLGYKFNEI